MDTNTDFLKFNAYSIKDSILQKLTEDSTFTDQIYEGSNLNILIDLFSYIMQGLLYALNNAAAESMFSDTQFFENMSRLCKFIGYNPKGMIPSYASFQIAAETKSVRIPEYSYIEAGFADSNGKNIYFSVVDGIETSSNYINLVNGIWRIYSTTFTASGIDWETFTLTDLKSDFNTKHYVADYLMHVYAITYYDDGSVKEVFRFRPASGQLLKPIYASEEIGYNNQGDFAETVTGKNALNDTGRRDRRSAMYSGVLKPVIFNDSESKHLEDSNDNIFNLKINENKQYVITFGDGINGAKPPEGSSIFVVYLDTNGPDFELTPNTIVNASLNYNNIEDQLKLPKTGRMTSIENDISLTNVSSATKARPEESVGQIKDSAASWFRMGNRLVTKDDYEYYFNTSPIAAAFGTSFKCQNNWEYISTFYRWLYSLGIKYHDNPKYYLTQNKLVNSLHNVVADPADSNNIYMWYVPPFNQGTTSDSGNDSLIIDMKKNIGPIKDMTHEVQIAKGIKVLFNICAINVEDAKKIINKKRANYDLAENLKNNLVTDSYLEITVSENCVVNDLSIKLQVLNKIESFFASNRKLGATLNFNTLLEDIYSIKGIENVRTIYLKNDNARNVNDAIIYPGISFASFTSETDGFSVEADDLEVSNSSRYLEVFQYPEFNKDLTYEDDFNKSMNKIKIIKRSASAINTLYY